MLDLLVNIPTNSVNALKVQKTSNYGSSNTSFTPNHAKKINTKTRFSSMENKDKNVSLHLATDL